METVILSDYYWECQLKITYASNTLPMLEHWWCTVHDMWQGRHDESPSGDLLEGVGESWWQAKQDILHENLFENLKKVGKKCQ